MSLEERIIVRLYDEEKCFGPGMEELLERVKVHHSLRAAAMSMQMAYSKAWTIIRRAEDAMGFCLLVSATGGRGGGGAVLTPEAELLVKQYRSYQQDLAAYAHTRFPEYFRAFLSEEAAAPPTDGKEKTPC